MRIPIPQIRISITGSHGNRYSSDGGYPFGRVGRDYDSWMERLTAYYNKELHPPGRRYCRAFFMWHMQKIKSLVLLRAI